MKAYTDLEQSKKLARILPIKSADMYYPYFGDNIWGETARFEEAFEYSVKKDIHCWSLAALLEQLKSEIQLENKQILFLHINKYDDINYEIRYTNSWSGEILIAKGNNIVDACVEMIIKLYEKLL